MKVRDYNGPAEFRPLGAWSYVGLTILYAIPVIGWVFLLVFTFHRGNINRRSFTRSYWCVLLILLLLGAGIFGVIRVNYGGSWEQAFDRLIESFFSTRPSTQSNGINLGVDPDLKRFLDEYELFCDEYIAFMEEYNSTEDKTADMLADYAELMDRYQAYSEELQNNNSENFSTADQMYYLEVLMRVEKKMMG